MELTQHGLELLFNYGVGGIMTAAFLYAVYYLSRRTIELLDSKDKRYELAVKEFTEATLESNKAWQNNTKALEKLIFVLTTDSTTLQTQ